MRMLRASSSFPTAGDLRVEDSLGMGGRRGAQCKVIYASESQGVGGWL